MKNVILLFSLCFLLAACNNCISDYQYSPPPDLNDGLATGTLESAGLDEATLTKAVNKISCGKFNSIHSMLIYKDGRLVLEKYFEGYTFGWGNADYTGDRVKWQADMPHQVMSCSKSVTSACIAIAISEGFIDSVEQSIFDYLPDYQAYKSEYREYITIEHLLTMSSGLAWNEWGAAHGTAANDIDRLYIECKDPIVCVLERPLVAPPGEFFTYNGGGIIILGEILKQASGLNIEEFSNRYLFDPLGIDSDGWWTFPNGVYESAGSLRLTPREMLHFGILYLQNGEWKGQRILPAEWVQKSSEIYGNNRDINLPIEDSGRNGYSYTWWISEFDFQGRKLKAYRANGWGGQVIMVFPELDMVVVFTGGNYAGKSKLFKLLRKYILPAINN